MSDNMTEMETSGPPVLEKEEPPMLMQEEPPVLMKEGTGAIPDLESHEAPQPQLMVPKVEEGIVCRNCTSLSCTAMFRAVKFLMNLPNK